MTQNVRTNTDIRNANLEKCVFCLKLSGRGVYKNNKFYCVHCVIFAPEGK